MHGKGVLYVFVFIPSASRLDPNVKRALQNGTLTTDEVRELYKMVAAHQKTRQKGFTRALFAVVGVFVLMAALSIPQFGSTALIFSMLATGMSLALILAFVKWFYVDAVKRQFYRAVRKGYPNYPFESLR